MLFFLLLFALLISYLDINRAKSKRNLNVELSFFLLMVNLFPHFLPGPLKVDIINGKEESINKLPGERMKKLLVELRVLSHCKCINSIKLWCLFMQDV